MCMLSGKILCKLIIEKLFISLRRMSSLRGEKKHLQLTKFIIGIFCINIYFCNSFTFLAEKSSLFVETKLKGIRLSLRATTEISLLDAKAKIQTLEDMVGVYKALPYFAEGSTLKTKYENALEPGSNNLKTLAKLYTQLYSLTDPSKSINPISSCIFEYSMLDKSALVEGVKYLQGKSMELSGVTTEAAMKADTVKMGALANFITAFNSICADWVHQIANVIGELDTLESLRFPDSLKGKIEMSSCLAGNGHEFEKINVISTSPTKEGFIAELDIGVPTELKEMIHLTPIVYDGIGLKGESEKVHFVREINSTIVKLFSCTSDLIWVDEQAPLCSELELPSLCRDGLMMENIDNIIKGCQFTYLNPPNAIRLKDEGILVQGENFTLKEGGQDIYESAPYVIYTDKTVIVKGLKFELTFPSLTTPKSKKILRSRLSLIQKLNLHSKVFWDHLYATFDIHEHIDWIAIFSEAIIFPIALCGLCLGIRKRVSHRNRRRRVEACRRRHNQHASRALFEMSHI